MARPELEPKTPLGQRLRDVREHAGGGTRDEFSKRLGISRAALAYYERGERVPDASALAAYRSKLGVDINWLVSGVGQMMGSSPQPLNARHLRDALMLVEEWLDNNDRIMGPEKKAEVVTELYQFIMDDAAQGRDPIDVKRIHGILRLVA